MASVQQFAASIRQFAGSGLQLPASVYKLIDSVCQRAGGCQQRVDPVFQFPASADKLAGSVLQFAHGIIQFIQAVKPVCIQVIENAVGRDGHSLHRFILCHIRFHLKIIRNIQILLLNSKKVFHRRETVTDHHVPFPVRDQPAVLHGHIFKVLPIQDQSRCHHKRGGSLAAASAFIFICVADHHMPALPFQVCGGNLLSVQLIGNPNPYRQFL